MNKTVTKQVVEMLNNIEKASQKGDTDKTIATVQQLIAYFYMYIQDLQSRHINSNELTKAVQKQLTPFMEET